MRVLFVNEYTAMRGGVDTVVNYQMDGLKKLGINTEIYSINHKEILSTTKISVLKYLVNSFQFRKFNNYIKEFKPDIIHLHNIYPLWGIPFWTKINNTNIKIVQHIHNYYPFCLNSFFYSNGKICTECFSQNSWFPGIRKRCYNNSLSNSLLSAIQKPIPKKWLAFSNNVNLFIGVSDFIVKKYIELGVNKNKIIKLENAILTTKHNSNTTGEYILYLGNVISPKGVRIVCELAKEIPFIKFIVAGDGKELNSLKKEFSKLKNLKFKGYVNKEEKDFLLQRSRFVIFPTLLWESFGLVILEAFKFGKPVLTTGEGATSELVKHKHTGIVVKDYNLKNMKKATINLWNELKEVNNYQKNCLYEVKHYTLQNHIEKLLKIYNVLLKN